MSDYLINRNGYLDYAIKLAEDALRVYSNPSEDSAQKMINITEPTRDVKSFAQLVSGIEPVESVKDLDKTLLATITLREIQKIRSKS